MKSVWIILGIVAGVTALGVGLAKGYKWLSDKMYRECYIHDSDFDFE